MSEIRTLREAAPEASKPGWAEHPQTLVVKAWGPFADGSYRVSVGHSQYTPAQAIRLATEIVECATAASRAQREAEREQTA